MTWLTDTVTSTGDTEAEELAEWMGDTDHAWMVPVGVLHGDAAAADSVSRQHFMNILLWRIGNAGRRIGRYRKVADLQKQMVDTWYERMSTSWRQRIADAERQIDALMRAEHQNDPQILTVKAPNGTVTYREPPVASLVVDDEETAVAWLKARGVKATRVTEVVARAELKKLAEPIGMDPPEFADPSLVYSRVAVDGEIVPGVHYERQAEATVTAKPR